MSSGQPDKPRIIVDEDWKTQVQREREELQGKPPLTSSPEGPQEFPAASFELLVTSLVTQTLAALGQLPDPNSQSTEVALPFARLNIDFLGVLQEKTKGNLGPDEATLLDDALHQLRMLYVAVRDGQIPPAQP